ncbi:MAG: MarR family transcriptional regulator [Candidatus Nanohaloarchaeota archaeon QJJ-9]|nr:MarR family transcriptional regulator [Candidatus Nanohaloarchaeota archaeon QJJ-9]
MYELTETELKILEILEISKGKSIVDIAKALGSDKGHVSRVVGKLEDKKLVKTERKRRKKARLEKSKSAEIYQKTTEKHTHIDFSELLKGKTIPVLYYLGRRRKVSEIADETGIHRTTIYRTVRKLLQRGMVRKKNSEYILKEEFKELNDFAEEYVHHLHMNRADKEYTTIWESLNEFLVQSKEEIKEENFHLTGPGLFENFGIPLLTKGKNHYFYTEKAEEITPQELICHMLLIDKGTRHQSYCMILISKESLDRRKLIKEAEKYRIIKTVKSLLSYLKNKGKEKNPEQPEWKELEKIAEEYGVRL